MPAVSVKERPILFSAQMVRAILEGRKTQTRRIVKPQFPNDTVRLFAGDGETCIEHPRRGFGAMPSRESCGADFDSFVRCPYGQPGNDLWVRETICSHCHHGAPLPLSPQRNGAMVWSYAADNVEPETVTAKRPSILMPRWASRITLGLTGVRVERLQDISVRDCEAEGVQIPVEKVQDPPVVGVLRVSGKFAPIQYFPPGWGSQKHTIEESTKVWLQAHYASLFESINGAGSWAKNPWCWVLSFRRLA